MNYYEPTKFVAKIRSKMQNVLSGTLCNDSNQKKTGKPVLLKVGNNGHFGSVGEEGIKELAFKMAFYLDNINK